MVDENPNLTNHIVSNYGNIQPTVVSNYPSTNCLGGYPYPYYYSYYYGPRFSIGLSGDNVIKLDTMTGDSWILRYGKWKKIETIENE